MTNFTIGDRVILVQHYSLADKGEIGTVVAEQWGTGSGASIEVKFDHKDRTCNPFVDYLRLYVNGRAYTESNEWEPATVEEMAVLDKFGIQYDIQECINIRIKGGK